MAYEDLIVFESSDDAKLNISGLISKFKKYEDEHAAAIVEKDILINAAISVGLGENSGKRNKVSKPVIKKKEVIKKKVAIGKGAIDGFFKKGK